jgi:hypothetical protein
MDGLINYSLAFNILVNQNYKLFFPAALAFFHLNLAAAAILALPATEIFFRPLFPGLPFVFAEVPPLNGDGIPEPAPPKTLSSCALSISSLALILMARLRS